MCSISITLITILLLNQGFSKRNGSIKIFKDRKTIYISWMCETFSLIGLFMLQKKKLVLDLLPIDLDMVMCLTEKIFIPLGVEQDGRPEWYVWIIVPIVFFQIFLTPHSMSPKHPTHCFRSKLVPFHFQIFCLCRH